MAPELEWWILDELNEGDEKSPWVRAIHYQPLQQDPGDLFLDGLCICLSKEVQEGAAEVVSVTVGVAQLIGDGIQEQVAACSEEWVLGNKRSKWMYNWPTTLVNNKVRSV